MATTIFLDPRTWDLSLDVNGNIAVATSTYQRAQDIASACHVFRGDIYFNQLDGMADIILLDTGAGISRDVSNFLMAADEMIIITTPEPHAMTDAYAIIKVMHNLQATAKKSLIVNKVEGELEAGIIASRLKHVVKQYLAEELEFIGGVEEDKMISRSLKKQCPLLLIDAECAPSRSIRKIADKLIDLPPQVAPKGISGFVRRLIDVFHPGGKKS